MICENSDGDGCRSCTSSLLRPRRRPEPGLDCPGGQGSDVAGSDRSGHAGTLRPVHGAQLVLLTVMAFLLPLVVSVVTVQTLESRAGSAVAAIAGVAAAGLSAATSAGIVRRLACPSEVTGADR